MEWTRPDMMDNVEVRVGLPRFKMEKQYNLKKVLVSMGMADAFDTSRSDFSGRTPLPNPLWCVRLKPYSRCVFMEISSPLHNSHRHVTRKQPVPFASGPQGFCGCQRGGNGGRRCHRRRHELALRSDASSHLHRRSPLPLLYPTQPLQERPVRWQILLPAVKEVLGF